MTSLRHRNTAAYFPRTRVPDPLNEFRLRSVAASGTIAGIYARTDHERGVWKAPAALEATLDNVSALDHLLTDAENGVINPLGLNALRNFDVQGNVVLGGTHTRRRRQTVLGVVIRDGPSYGTLSRRVALPRHAVGGL